MKLPCLYTKVHRCHTSQYRHQNCENGTCERSFAVECPLGFHKAGAASSMQATELELLLHCWGVGFCTVLEHVLKLESLRRRIVDGKQSTNQLG